MPKCGVPVRPKEALDAAQTPLCLLGFSPEIEDKVIANNAGFVAAGGQFNSVFAASSHHVPRIVARPALRKARRSRQLTPAVMRPGIGCSDARQATSVWIGAHAAFSEIFRAERTFRALGKDQHFSLDRKTVKCSLRHPVEE